MSDRREETWIWGHHSIEAVLETTPELVLEVIADKGGLQNLPRKLMELITESGVTARELGSLPKVNADGRTQGLMAKLKHFPVTTWPKFEDNFRKRLQGKKASQWAVLDRLQDPRNYGAILRSAAAFGLAGVFVTTREQSPLTGVVAAASAGNVFRVQIIEALNLKYVLEAARECEAEVLGLDMGKQSLDEGLRESSGRPVVWVIGSEGAGIRPGLRESCTRIVSIPMAPSVESLNASAAATVAFYAGSRSQA